eukprot:scaffold130794_cov38-Prasinocladus_malaysianus.AAC.1
MKSTAANSKPAPRPKNKRLLTPAMGEVCTATGAGAAITGAMGWATGVEATAAAVTAAPATTAAVVTGHGAAGAAWTTVVW